MLKRLKRAPIVKIILFWLPLAILTTFIFGMMYATVQQSYRQNANDPQVQMAEDAATFLNKGQAPRTLVPFNQTDMKALDPFLIIFDNNHNVLATSVQLDGKTPTPPAGAFDYAKKHGQHRFTWEPEGKVRNAVILLPYQNDKTNGFVLAGRNLREVEAREDQLTKIVGLAWLITLISTWFGVAITLWLTNEKAAKAA